MASGSLAPFHLLPLGPSDTWESEGLSCPLVAKRFRAEAAGGRMRASAFSPLHTQSINPNHRQTAVQKRKLFTGIRTKISFLFFLLMKGASNLPRSLQVSIRRGGRGGQGRRLSRATNPAADAPCGSPLSPRRAPVINNGGGAAKHSEPLERAGGGSPCGARGLEQGRAPACKARAVPGPASGGRRAEAHTPETGAQDARAHRRPAPPSRPRPRPMPRPCSAPGPAPRPLPRRVRPRRLPGSDDAGRMRGAGPRRCRGYR